MGQAQPQDHLITPEEYPASERMATQRHEYLNGAVYAMAGAVAAHNRIAANIGRRLGNQLEGKRCESLSTELRVHIRTKNAESFTTPDLPVDCCGDSDTALYADEPAVIFGIMSPETERVDRHEKFSYYQTISSLRTYVLIGQCHLAGPSIVGATMAGPPKS